MNYRLSLALTLLLALPTACGDDGGGGGSDGGNGAADADPNVVTTAFRSSKLALLEPHAFAFGSVDVTDTVNDAITEAVDADMSDPPDGVLDLNVSMLFHPLDPAASSTPMTISFADCSAPLASTTCTQTGMTTIIPTTATNDSTSPCLDALPGTTDPESMPAVTAVPAPCFASEEVDVTLPLGTITLPLRGTTIAATYSGSPPTSLVTGLLRGYMTKADADMVLIPDSVALVGGMPISSLFRDEDMDAGPGGEMMGWWFYISVEANVVEYSNQ